MAYPIIPSPNVTRTSGRSVDTIVIHTMEIRERDGAAKACAEWFARRNSEVSAHYCVDADTVICCVPEQDIAWHARGGNATSIGIELAGYARQSGGEWKDSYSHALLKRAARLTADIAARHGIPIRWLAAADLRQGQRGITGHADVSAAFRKSDHWDPGPGFPRVQFLRLVAAADPRAIEQRHFWERPPPTSARGL